MVQKDLTLAKACAPLFLYLATFRRNADTSRLSLEELRRALQRELEAARERCEQERRLAPLFDRVWYALVATADQVVLTSSSPHRSRWSVSLLEQHYFKTAEGGKEFYKLVDEILGDPTDPAVQMAEVLFTCMSLGFQGELLGERRELERRRRLLFEKARLPGVLGETLAPDAYNKNVARRAIKLPTANIMRLVLVTVVSLVFALLIHWSVEEIAKHNWSDSLRPLKERFQPGERGF